MRLHLLCVGARQPAWIDQGFETYARRMPHDCALELKEIAAVRRSRSGDAGRALEKESERLIRAIPRHARVVALDVNGTPWSTPELAGQLDDWRRSYQDVALLIGGADGLSSDCLARAQQKWSLSKLTLPHGLARVLVAEQLYRAWSVLAGHPYHRE